jgi:tetratricopeptide (TPR) repeat protein
MHRLVTFFRSTKGQAWLLGAILVAAVVFAYHPAWNAGFIWDDDDYVINNKLLTAPDGLQRIWFSLDSPSQYFPLTYTTFRIERALWGLNASGYHWVNILLHALNALLVWRLLERLKIPGAWLAAALFALHPVQVESVAWVTECKNVLSLLFFLLALRTWVEFTEEISPHRKLQYGLSLIFFALALFAKTTACTLPAALLLVLWLKKKPITAQRLAQIVPYLAIGLGMGFVTIWWERFHQGTQGKSFALDGLQRILVASRAIWFYVGKLIWPANLTFSYPHWTIDASSPLAYLGLAACAVVAVLIWLIRRRVGRGVEVAVLFFATTLAPVLGFVMLYTFLWSYVADHYQYVACIGLLTLAAAGITLALRRLNFPILHYAVCGTLLFTLSGLTWRQCRMYRDVETLWRVTIERNPSSWLAAYNLGTILGEKHQVDEGIQYLQKTVEIRPEFAGGHYNLGSLYLYKKELAPAIGELQKAIEFEPRHALAYYKLGDALMQKGQMEQAIPEFEKAIEIWPACVDAHRSLAQARFQQGRLDDAITHFQQAATLQPNVAADYIFLGNAFLQKQNLDAALASFRKAVELKPDFLTYNNLGNALLQKGQTREAVTNFQKSLELQPHYLLAENNLAFILATSSDASLRNGTKAVELAEDADRQTGGQNPVIIVALGAAYAEAGRFPDAIAAAKRGLQLATAQNNQNFVTTFQGHLALYEAGKPFRP